MGTVGAWANVYSNIIRPSPQHIRLLFHHIALTRRVANVKTVAERRSGSGRLIACIIGYSTTIEPWGRCGRMCMT